jgi:hypothetical protein
MATRQNVCIFDAVTGKLHPHASLVLIDALEVPAKVVMGFIDGRAQQPL